MRLEELSDGQTAPNKVYDDLLAYRQAVAVEVKPHKPSTQYVHVTSEATCFNMHKIPPYFDALINNLYWTENQSCYAIRQDSVISFSEAILALVPKKREVKRGMLEWSATELTETNIIFINKKTDHFQYADMLTKETSISTTTSDERLSQFSTLKCGAKSLCLRWDRITVTRKLTIQLITIYNTFHKWMFQLYYYAS